MKKASKGKTQEGAQATTSDVGGEPSRDDTQAKSTSGKGKSAAVKNDDTAMGEEEFNKVMKRRRQDAERKRKQRANASDEVSTPFFFLSPSELSLSLSKRLE